MFLPQEHEMGPAELSPRNPAIHSHAFTHNLLFGTLGCFLVLFRYFLVLFGENLPAELIPATKPCDSYFLVLFGEMGPAELS